MCFMLTPVIIKLGVKGLCMNEPFTRGNHFPCSMET